MSRRRRVMAVALVICAGTCFQALGACTALAAEYALYMTDATRLWGLLIGYDNPLVPVDPCGSPCIMEDDLFWDCPYEPDSPLCQGDG